MTGGYSLIQHSSVLNILCMIINTAMQLHIRLDMKWLLGKSQTKIGGIRSHSVGCTSHLMTIQVSDYTPSPIMQ